MNLSILNGDFPQLCKRLLEVKPPFSHGFPIVFPWLTHSWFTHQQVSRLILDAATMALLDLAKAPACDVSEKQTKVEVTLWQTHIAMVNQFLRMDRLTKK